MLARNLVWCDMGIKRKDREQKNYSQARVLWLTGLSGAGKSTIGRESSRRLCERRSQAYVLDGDNVRHGLNSDLGFSPENRKENIRRVAEVAKLFVDAGFIVITSFISPYKEDRERARMIFSAGDFVEVHVKADVFVCEKRDTKGLYKKARQGLIPEFTGISAPYEAPDNPEICVDTENHTVKESVDQIMQYLKNGIFLPKKTLKKNLKSRKFALNNSKK